MTNISIEQSNEFHLYFQEQRQDIQTSLNDSSSSSTNDLSGITQKISSLRLEVDQISSSLPIYDRVKYDKQITELEQNLSSIKLKDKPKSKFTFNKTHKSSNSANTRTSTPISSHLDIQPKSTASKPPSQPVLSGSSLSSSSSPTSHTISNLSNQLITPPNNVSGTYTISLSNLQNCIIDLRSTLEAKQDDLTTEIAQPRLTAIHAKFLERCILISPIMKGSALLDEVKDSLLVLGCQQFRIHSSSNTTILLNVQSLPVIEHSKSLRFGSYPDFMIDSVVTDIDNQKNHLKVQDFDWPLPSPSPNWSAIPNTDAFGSILSDKILDKSDNLGSNETVEQILDEVLVKVEKI
ncbi:uncharacterized protein L201_007256 [Kwoniella dendrophila CBS 6074]|uniref:C-CAP/cofactor C-like domain-containing protein n=1 Tax=Kwoniella dendrophila CBS 6074 TaxID=1295534 RepID=A0AAX4K413_9TREE